MNSFPNKSGGDIIKTLIGVIQQNKAYLSEIDGAIGDGDHGVNMDKGFSMCMERVHWDETDFSGAARTLSRILLMEIGGSMGPIYGTFFGEMAKATAGKEDITPADYSSMFHAAIKGIQGLGDAKLGDKTMLDTLIPAIEAFDKCIAEGGDFCAALHAMTAAAKAGWEGTKDMVAKVGRASRLGERSRGVLDAGATSCYLIIESMGGVICGYA